MTDKEKLDKLVAEIERLIGDYNIKTEKYRGMNEQAHQYYGGKRDALSEILKSIGTMQEECIYSKDNYTDEDRKALCDGCNEECRFNKKEDSVNNGLDLGCGVIWKDKEPASEDSEEVTYQGEEYIRCHHDELVEAAKAYSMFERSDDSEVGYDINRFGGFVDGADWQLKKAINWLKSNINCNMWIKDFIKNMEE